MSNDTLLRKELHGYPYAVFGSVLFDTVPVEYADEWLAAAPEADTLILCGANPFPKTVRRFLEARPGGKIARGIRDSRSWTRY